MRSLNKAEGNAIHQFLRTPLFHRDLILNIKNNSKMKKLIFILVIYVSSIYVAAIEPIYEWKFLEYKWDSEEQKQRAINSGVYNRTASAPMDVDMDEDERLFITIYKIEGVPATLGIVDTEGGISEASGGPLIRPYPNWTWHANDCDGLVNVFRIAIDECNQLWVLDSGMIQHRYKCPAKLVVFDLKTDRAIKRIEIPRELYSNILVNFLIHNIDPECREPSVYMTDVYGYGLVIYDSEENFCRLEVDEFKPEPGADTYTIAGEELTLRGGIYALALSARDDTDPDDEQILYFRPLSSFSMYSVMANELRNYCVTARTPDFNKGNYTMPSQSTAHTVANDVLFFGYTDETSLNCWNTNKPFNEKTIGTLSQDEEQLQWIQGIKTYPKTRNLREDIIFVTNKFQEVYEDLIDVTKVNYRIFRTNAYESTSGTVCGK